MLKKPPLSIEYDSLLRPVPFVKLFHTDEGYYVYDVNTNRIIKVSVHFYCLLDCVLRGAGIDDYLSKTERLIRAGRHHEGRDVESLTAGTAREQVGKYRELADSGALSGFTPDRMSRFSSGDRLKDYDSGVQQMILEVTQDCNLTCSYCSLGDHYDYNRKSSSRSMPLDVAKKAIAYFAERTGGADYHCIGFYGGEPLLRPGFVEECLRFAGSRGLGVDLDFSMTTNGTIMNDDILRMCSENDISLLVSVDGSRGCHDANRRFANGRGSWDRIVRNLNFIRENDRDYYRRRVGFACTISPNVDPLGSYLFFQEHNEIVEESSKNIVMTFVSDCNTTFYDEYKPDEEWFRRIRSLRNRYLQMVVGKDDVKRNRYLENHFYKKFLTIYKRKIHKRLPRTIPLNGCCVPGIRRIYVDAGGTFHICERINDRFPIGDVHKGYDFERIKKIYDNYIEINERSCTKCWLVRFCTMCFAQIAGDGRFDRELREIACDTIKKEFLNDLIDYCRIAEYNPAAFNFMEEVVLG